MISRSDRTVLMLTALLCAAFTGCVGEDGGQQPGDAPSGDPQAAALIADADRALGDGALSDAAQKLDAARAIDPDNPAVWVTIARLRFRGGEHLTALDAADRALALGPDHAPALLMRAFMVRDAHGPTSALPWFEAALSADPENPDIWAEYAATLGDSGKGRAMLRAARKLAEIAPQDPRGLYLQAVLAARGGNPALARSLLVRSKLSEQGVPAAQQLDAVLSLSEGNYDSAADTLTGLVQRQPANARMRELLARALLLGGHETELIARFGDEASRSEASPYLIMLVARAHERLGERERAAPLLARAYAGAARTPTVLAERAYAKADMTQAILDQLLAEARAAHAAAGADSVDAAAKLVADMVALGGQIGLSAA